MHWHRLAIGSRSIEKYGHTYCQPGEKTPRQGCCVSQPVNTRLSRETFQCTHRVRRCRRFLPVSLSDLYTTKFASDSLIYFFPSSPVVLTPTIEVLSIRTDMHLPLCVRQRGRGRRSRETAAEIGASKVTAHTLDVDTPSCFVCVFSTVNLHHHSPNSSAPPLPIAFVSLGQETLRCCDYC